jgi:hypothetical protein
MWQRLVAFLLVSPVLASPGCGGESVIGVGNVGGTGGLGATGGSGGTTGGAGGATGGTGVSGGSGGSGGSFPGGYGSSCDIQVALSKSCARTGCHSAIDHYAGLDLSNPANVLTFVDKPASHGDINCAAPGSPFRACTPSELPEECEEGALLLDSRYPDDSWILKKLRGETGCGDAMPLPPGNSPSNGWNDARRQCLEDWFYSIASGTPGGGGTGGAGGSGARGPLGTCNNGLGGCGGIDASGCDLRETLKKSCARTGCHSALDRYGSIDLSDPTLIGAQMIDQPAPHSDINCAEAGMPFRACAGDELAARCSGSDVAPLLIDTANPQNSWVFKKLYGEQGSCGDAMPLPPGNSPENWSEESRVCIERFFNILATSPEG